MIDSADRRRMEETGVELQQLMDEVSHFCLILFTQDTTHNCPTLNHFLQEKLAGIPLVIFANKQVDCCERVAILFSTLTAPLSVPYSGFIKCAERGRDNTGIEFARNSGPSVANLPLFCQRGHWASGTNMFFTPFMCLNSVLIYTQFLASFAGRNGVYRVRAE